MSWNGYPNRIKNFLIDELQRKYNSPQSTHTPITVDNILKIWIHLPYLGTRGENLINSCIKKIRRCLMQPVKFIIIYDTKKISYFTSNKDKVPAFSRNKVIYQITILGATNLRQGRSRDASKYVFLNTLQNTLPVQLLNISYNVNTHNILLNKTTTTPGATNRRFHPTRPLT